MENKKRALIIALVVIVGVAIAFILFGKNKESIEIILPKDETSSGLIPYSAPANASKITGLACDNYQKRPFAVMYSGDAVARKWFSNLSQADFVLEMPHRAVHGDPRLMGVFQCNTPEVVGPMRSGRVDNISIAGSLDAIFIPWGGSSIAKGILKKGLIDHIDCNGEVAPSGSDGVTCFRRQDIPANNMIKASSSIPRLTVLAKEVGYRQETDLKGYPHQGDISLESRPEYGKLKVKFGNQNIDVEYLYDKKTNAYLRFIDDREDIDYATKTQYAPKNLITINTQKDTWLLNVDYVGQGLQDPWDGVDDAHSINDSGGYPNMQLGDPWFDTKYEGEAKFFFNGKEIVGTWKRTKGLANQFEFFDDKGEEIYFVPGQIWLHVLGLDQTVSYEKIPE